MQNRAAGAPLIHIAFHIHQDDITRIVLSNAQVFNYTLFPNHSNLKPLIEKWIQSYLDKQKSLPVLPLRLQPLKDFMQKVLNALQQIPIGETASYLEIAKAAGRPNASRAVGNICHRNPFPLVIPCHRVIQSNGQIGGFAYELELKKQLLAFEAQFF